MNNKVLTVFFIILTLSIGLVSENLPLSSYAQNNALYQNGNGDSEQEIEQSQLSGQDDQVVSGDSTIASGNSALCQTMENSVDVSSVCPPRVGYT
ncbi:hypothetical protein [Candidatus Nitrosocosmicus arcticus]|uniref:Uncharacterized protein n=1 Tax=Candidatus Nitrosocosmicus arcticus TaxID=2035267 RepID=A0A557SXR1_9ARCH|nr:hypothetical protein [Candidatus Nitrosocosmicus arcticus]TVP41382.1 exported protein of unknown function [Candidatus Nitrosocosmicus arcticus]